MSFFGKRTPETLARMRASALARWVVRRAPLPSEPLELVRHYEPDLHPEVTAIQDKFLARYGRPGERPYGERLRLYRVAMKMSADDVAGALGKPVQVVRGWEEEIGRPDEVDQIILASVLSVPLNWVEPVTISKAA